MGRSRKGGAWEREMCRELSYWLSCGRRDDWLWRSSQSGGRATTRRKKGKRTSGHCGDIAATCRRGERLTRVFAIELKRGYAKTTAADIFDRAGGAAQQQFEAFIQQAIEAHENAGTYSWLLFHKRDQRNAVVWMELSTEKALKRHGAFDSRPFMRAQFDTVLRFKGGDNVRCRRKRIVGIDLGSWLELVPPESIVSLWKEWKGK